MDRTLVDLAGQPLAGPTPRPSGHRPFVDLVDRPLGGLTLMNVVDLTLVDLQNVAEVALSGIAT